MTMSSNRRSFAVHAGRLVILVAALLGGCALSPERPEVAAASQALAARQHHEAEQAARLASGRRLWFAGFAMNSTSHAFEGDLELVARRLSALDGPVLRYEFSNQAQTSTLRYPFAGPEPMAETLRRIGAQARPDDIVVLLVSTHGGRQVLSVNVAGREYPPMTAHALAKALEPLHDTPTVVLLSACYSGSFLPSLRRDNRIVLTAASANRSSHGCSFESRNTFFIEELMANHFDPSMSLAQLAGQAQAQVAQRESQLKLKPSQPQVAVGAQVAWLAQTPLKDWFTARRPEPVLHAQRRDKATASP